MDDTKLAKKMFGVLSYIIKKEIHPQNTVTFLREINCEGIEEVRNHHFQVLKSKPSYTSFIIQALGKAIEKHPYVNARIFPGIISDYIHQFDNIDIAVACEQNYKHAEFFAFADIIRNINSIDLNEIDMQLRKLANATEENNQQLKTFVKIIKNAPISIARFLLTLPAKIPSMWVKYRGACIMISSPAKYGVDGVIATWTHPIGISFGLVQKKALVVDGNLKSTLAFTLSMNFDRRIIAGAQAAKFFNTIVNNLTAVNKNNIVAIKNAS